jgi:hypothetical protein
MSKYRKAFLIWIASIALTITGFSICGPHLSSHLASRPIGAAASSLPGAEIEVSPWHLVQ